MLEGKGTGGETVDGWGKKGLEGNKGRENHYGSGDQILFHINHSKLLLI